MIRWNQFSLLTKLLYKSLKMYEFYVLFTSIENWDISKKQLLLFTKYNVSTFLFRNIPSNNGGLFSNLKNSSNCCRTNCKRKFSLKSRTNCEWKFCLNMGQLLSSCFGCLSEPEKKPQKKSTIRFVEFGTIEIAEDQEIEFINSTNKRTNGVWWSQCLGVQNQPII